MYKGLEQNIVHWTSKVGLECYALRWSYSDHWRGYVVIPEGHIFYMKDYDDCIKKPPCEEGLGYCKHTARDMLDVHGGITYADWAAWNLPKVWLLGFDCGHVYDDPMFGGTYKDLDFVKNECEHLAEQLV